MSDDRQLPKELVDVLANEILKKKKTHTKSMDEWQKTWQGIRKGVGEPTRGHTCVLPNLPCGAKKMARTILSAFHFFHLRLCSFVHARGRKEVGPPSSNRPQRTNAGHRAVVGTPQPFLCTPGDDKPPLRTRDMDERRPVSPFLGEMQRSLYGGSIASCVLNHTTSRCLGLG